MVKTASINDNQGYLPEQRDTQEKGNLKLCIFFFRMNLWWEAGMQASVEDTGEGRSVHVKEKKGSAISQVKPCNDLMTQQVSS